MLLNTTTLMACITPFLAEHFYRNLRNGISEDDKDLYAKSIHFLQIPNYDESLLDQVVERRFNRMQSAIVNGRLIRDRKNLSLKQPLSAVTVVDQEEEALQDFRTVAAYITEELNCLELRTEADEDEFVVYKCTPDNTLMGGALKKAFNKQMKADIKALTSAQLRDYLKNGFLMLGDVRIEKEWLKVEKDFKPKYADGTETACASSMTSSVMLATAMTPELVSMGHSREITNRIQKLRKSAGIQIDDQIEVFYQVADGSTLHGVISAHSDKIRKVIKMPFVPHQSRQKQAVLIDETTFENPDDATDVVTLYICKPAVQLDLAAIEAQFAGVNTDSLGSLMNSYSPEALKRMVEESKGVLKVTLDGKALELHHKKHFWLNALDRQ